jgi:hypothetical protein
LFDFQQLQSSFSHTCYCALEYSFASTPGIEDLDQQTFAPAEVSMHCKLFLAKESPKELR